jgi:long-subunit fatty acid transport protein
MTFRNSTLALTLAVAGACFAGSVAHASIFEGEQCSAHIQTAHPGIDVTVSNGAVFRSLAACRT